MPGSTFGDQFIECAEVKDRKYHFRSYPNCFVGKDVVAALIQKGYVENAQEAVDKGNILLKNGLFAHVTQEHAFENGSFFYRFFF
jgi:hypothetical protein